MSILYPRCPKLTCPHDTMDTYVYAHEYTITATAKRTRPCAATDPSTHSQNLHSFLHATYETTWRSSPTPPAILFKKKHFLNNNKTLEMKVNKDSIHNKQSSCTLYSNLCFPKRFISFIFLYLFKNPFSKQQ